VLTSRTGRADIAAEGPSYLSGDEGMRTVSCKRSFLPSITITAGGLATLCEPHASLESQRGPRKDGWVISKIAKDPSRKPSSPAKTSKRKTSVVTVEHPRQSRTIDQHAL
jgi:hypothetical protein